jgi:hypothetical protein
MCHYFQVTGETMSDERFNASKYLTQVEGREYLEVKWRLLWLRSEHPDALISTELVDHQDGLALFRARVALPEGGEASGWGSETPRDFPDYIEAAETKALGRALAALGYGTQFCEDFDLAATGEAVPGEAADCRRGVADAPTEPPSVPASGGGRRPLGASQPQIRTIYSIARGNRALGEEGVRSRCRAAYGCLPEELTRRQASQFIDALKKETTG